MSKPKRTTKVDPELRKQLDKASADERPVQAVFVLRQNEAAQGGPPTGEETDELARELLARVAEQVGGQADDFNIFRNMGSFVVSAKPAFVRALLEQPEVSSAVANQQPAE